VFVCVAVRRGRRLAPCQWNDCEMLIDGLKINEARNTTSGVKLTVEISRRVDETKPIEAT